jgi:hypothetical protein
MCTAVYDLFEVNITKTMNTYDDNTFDNTYVIVPKHFLCVVIVIFLKFYHANLRVASIHVWYLQLVGEARIHWPCSGIG